MYDKAVMQIADLKVGGISSDVRAPSTYKVGTGDIDLGSKRSMSGYMNRNRIRGGNNAVYTLTLSWQKLTWKELETLIRYTSPQQFVVKFLDPSARNSYTEKTMYRDANMEYELVNIFSDEEAYWTCTMSLVEF